MALLILTSRGERVQVPIPSNSSKKENKKEKRKRRKDIKKGSKKGREGFEKRK
jgi:hypothetical protein